MKHRFYSNQQYRTFPQVIGKLLLAIAWFAIFASAQADDRYQLRVLFSPTSQDLAAEAGGRIMIYDRLKSETVDRAMDEQFERIENMMFIRTLHQQEDGSEIMEDDDC